VPLGQLQQTPLGGGGGEGGREQLPPKEQRDGDWQGLILVHFSAQPEPFLTQNTPKTPLRNLKDLSKTS